MIYICKYDGQAGDDRLWELSRRFPLDLPEARAEVKNWEHQRQRILAWLLLSAAVKREYGLALEALDIRRREKGKPWSAARPDIHFNLSHCPVACACAVGEGELGVDIERKFPYRESLERKICHGDEKKVLEGLAPELRPGQLSILWSMKESFVKLDGRGLGYGMSRVNLAPFLPAVQKEKGGQLLECRVTFPASAREALPRFAVWSLPDWTLAVCGESVPDTVCLLREAELI